ncbi:MAG: integrase/recombinase XerD [Candidatus Atribacteria bacterium]|nr:integrase/recombinase XerD [Candidatus Atribacteria bacterium]
MGEVVKLHRPEGFHNLLELFLFEKKAEGKAPRTIHDYEVHVIRFFRRFPQALRSEKELRTSILKYFSDDIKPATFNLRRQYLKAFFDFLVRENVIEKNPVDFKKRKDEGRARAIPLEVLKELLNVPDKKSYAGFRDYCLILFMLDTGIRPGEALKLKKEDFIVNLKTHCKANCQGRSHPLLSSRARRFLPGVAISLFKSQKY